MSYADEKTLRSAVAIFNKSKFRFSTTSKEKWEWTCKTFSLRIESKRSFEQMLVAHAHFDVSGVSKDFLREVALKLGTLEVPFNEFGVAVIPCPKEWTGVVSLVYHPSNLTPA
jgi:hypothetical protein